MQASETDTSGGNLRLPVMLSRSELTILLSVLRGRAEYDIPASTLWHRLTDRQKEMMLRPPLMRSNDPLDLPPDALLNNAAERLQSAVKHLEMEGYEEYARSLIRLSIHDAERAYAAIPLSE